MVQVRVSRSGVATRVGKRRRRRRDAVLVATRMRPSARVYGVEDRCREEDEPGTPGSKYQWVVRGRVGRRMRGHAYNVPDSTSRGRWTTIDPPSAADTGMLPGGKTPTTSKLIACRQLLADEIPGSRVCLSRVQRAGISIECLIESSARWRRGTNLWVIL